ncbi:hypothetical protein A3C91_04185 [Candidatus Azambacteria bacterium RIFCSPHIGHO2_02_FULL_52_12]|uniref:Uncharacterized protein n=1 Tax=Candidatus Azambacteria bacterium RIFCSPLOWO2_01_FULL_46_25 TaxID=1797298 RepID=A0A1F5BV28_9BACT|nr:MAG: hypothetical protein A3C91_04185 [Candidatus Azambacteria bacterium RIFCSPHIGHO2_02_FULL_52_12]OGD34442.1 MAG: hypothetical protein A2988_02870 [Candidatus Azambacteria bacterium RIFCSPLOWO2_01_FULL_46_25]OGD37280.1 MAG: hypothetical protein A2850_01020 [Candidatus Azambacteria bacterium RIFCSPHIGHO2_01_FULL_51_74]
MKEEKIIVSREIAQHGKDRMFQRQAEQISGRSATIIERMDTPDRVTGENVTILKVRMDDDGSIHTIHSRFAQYNAAGPKQPV